MSLNTSVATRDDFDEVKLEGAVVDDSGAALVALAGSLRTQRIVFHCDGIERINSYGAVHWTRFLAGMPAGRDYVFLGCPPPFVNYANLLPGFCRGGRIESAYFRFECSACGRVDQVLLPRFAWAGQAELSRRACASCHAKASMASESALSDYPVLTRDDAVRDVPE